MIPSHQQAKDEQDAARREQQADERIRELEDALDQALSAIRGRTFTVGEFCIYQPQIDIDRVEQWQDALDKGGDNDA